MISFIRYFAQSLFYTVLFLAALTVIARAQSQQTRTTCYHSGSTEICETFDQYGAILSKSRCYRSGKDLRCDTQNFQPLHRQ
jgi:hypothetical protein